MTDNDRATREWNQALERLAADAADTAYAIALRHRTCGSWIDLELELWKALARTVGEWGCRSDGVGIERYHAIRNGNDRPHVGTVLHQKRSKR
jgi:hypothetical protein